MGKLVVSLDGVVIKEVQITKDKTTLGRRPYNDIVIDNLAVSGEHAVLQMVGADVFIEDLNSTNGTYINGKAVKKQLLAHNDTVEIGKYKIKFMVEDGTDYEKTMIMKPGTMAVGARPRPAYARRAGASGFGGLAGRRRSGNVGPATIRVMNGAAAGREVVADQGRHDRRQARRAGRVDHQAADRLRARARRRRGAADGERHAARRRNGQPEERRRHRARRHADAVRPGRLSGRRAPPSGAGAALARIVTDLTS